MACYLSPIGNEAQIDSNGNPVSGGKIYTYLAGTSTPAATYTDDTGGTPQANPVILNSAGLPASPIWLQGGTAYKFVFEDANGVSYRPAVDDITGINDPAVAGTPDQWVIYQSAATYIGATQFSVVGDQTNVFQVNRRVRTVNSGGTYYGRITVSSFAAGITTVTVSFDSGSMDSGLSQVSYGLLSYNNNAIPETSIGNALRTASTVAAGQTAIGVQDLRWGMTNGSSLSVAGAFASFTDETNQNQGGGNSASGGTYTAPVTGVYLISATFTITGTPSATGVVSAGIAVNGTAIGTNGTVNIGTGDVANLIRVITVSTSYRLAAGDVVTCRNNGTNPASLSTQCTRFRGALIRQSS